MQACATSLIDLARDGDAGLPEHMGDLRLPQARGVVFERQLVGRWVDAEATQAIRVCELAKVAQLVVGQRGLQFIGDFHEGHCGIIPAGAGFETYPDVTPIHLTW
jgi:hypothetical protein